MTLYNNSSSSFFMSVKELNERKNKCVYLLLVDDMIIGASWKSDIDKYLTSDDSLITIENGLEDAQLIHGFVLDPEELPYELPLKLMEKRSVYLFMASTDGGESIGVEEYSNMEEVAASIEKWMQEDEDSNIEDFAVVVAEEVSFALTVKEAGDSISEKDVYVD